MGLSDLFEVRIVFDESHLFFPRIIQGLLLAMALVIVVVRGIPTLRAVWAGHRTWPVMDGPFDHLRFFGTLGLTVAYFLLMPPVGEMVPNTGLGFLIVSIPYMAALSVLYLHRRDRRTLLLAMANALIAPVAVWYLLARLLNVTLP
ncbi:tripartite tricarboxylate transporter TctB family protein [Roseospira visakhapatnamensis]|uniref:Apolipoprotein N-acyltransferase n=1 Tax=Roseospira visakhapatnamensis TaxID=390880 RepID=A0A7W6RAB9_9PROT|nr:tripartite tricarboxylate transporter TctB family protein [Roseospira visakhapatnamensis]MBB4264672.1 apolipoprotein N-acyltransferase [Roseospira visakhapatnamensis]